MTEIYAFRHGETDWNKEKRFQGQTNTPLNNNGEQQCLSLKACFASIDVETILSSDLDRARRTAEIVFEGRNIPLVTNEHLREANLGHGEGMTRDDFLKKFGTELWDRWRSGKDEDLDVRLPNGDSPRIHRDRVLGFLNHWLTNNSVKSAAISTHGGTIWRILSVCEAYVIGREEAIVANCSLLHLRWDKGKWTYVKQIQ